MTQKTLSAIVFSVLLAIELFSYMSQGELKKTIVTGERKGFFGGTSTVRDTDAEKDREKNALMLMGVTVLAGALITFTLPDKKIGKKD